MLDFEPFMESINQIFLEKSHDFLLVNFNPNQLQ